MAQYLYVCHFSNGHIKVGRSVDPQSRIAEHEARVKCVGISLIDSFAVPCICAVEKAEAELIERCVDKAESRNLHEWFSGLDFEFARDSAIECAKLVFVDEDKDHSSETTERFAANLTKLIVDEGLSERAFCAKYGIQQRTVNRIVNRKNSPSLATVDAIAKAIGVSVASLITAIA